MENLPLPPTAGTSLQRAMTRRLLRRSVATGEISLPAVPGMLEAYVTMCANLFGTLGSEFSPEQIDELRGILHAQLTEAFTASPRSEIVISYSAPVGTVLNYHVKSRWWTVEGAYENWIATREPPLFGSEPDARVWSLSTEAADPRSFPILDLGAGTGRNALALARRGHPVDVVEMTASFAESIRAAAQSESLPVRVLQRDIFATTDDLRSDYRLILLSEVVSDFRSTDQLRGIFDLASRCLAPDGRLVFNAFVAHRDYTPDDAALQLGQQCYTTIFTQPQMADALAGFPLALVSDMSVYDYEKNHLPAGTWPPTSWYAEWVSGQDVFDVPRDERPIEMRWLVYERSDSTPE
ncbi:class I SAM-dependent methyltransferase [Mycobacterium crocinum]|uniref:Class I SAM-dependent methyltransferase n=1 Tax=Mycolicibacterium crocinum TaxID=388459 RepID=A0ABY3TN07_9MYCO|nr:class I SAM-dependent methyltransferase [Mycolicibacterium crocinum]MCV7216627.1 class I SAM-dependent methyltransferase [Mycolicibacterium crocinum]ULN40550.1 class I SAM-dependent methyltransferase [Mycolicibacterium crocinum]